MPAGNDPNRGIPVRLHQQREAMRQDSKNLPRFPPGQKEARAYAPPKVHKLALFLYTLLFTDASEEYLLPVLCYPGRARLPSQAGFKGYS
ncbi:hypothetical protein ALO_17121 [Acetonema longum DSM 6540]|uniref:Uncharacterized protein n=1 Tax=Acetonema longum DSM 6540 TaxID=1009370 RepID=F7NMU3_9FIRM|nr:hypothetical protein ALO_17121 [Acetonema longum DSM 6540]